MKFFLIHAIFTITLVSALVTSIEKKKTSATYSVHRAATQDIDLSILTDYFAETERTLPKKIDVFVNDVYDLIACPNNYNMISRCDDITFFK